MKSLLICSFVLCSIAKITYAQDKNDDNPKIDVYLNDYRNNKIVKATSEKSAYFAQAFYELIEDIKLFKDAKSNVEGNITYNVRQISTQRPITRSNGLKIYNGYLFVALETVDKVPNVICTFAYDIDTNALYWYVTGTGKFQKLLYADQGYLNKCARYCRFYK